MCRIGVAYIWQLNWGIILFAHWLKNLGKSPLTKKCQHLTFKKLNSCKPSKFEWLVNFDIDEVGFSKSNFVFAGSLKNKKCKNLNLYFFLKGDGWVWKFFLCCTFPNLFAVILRPCIFTTLSWDRNLFFASTGIDSWRNPAAPNDFAPDFFITEL